jgi:hypothetical protein
MGLATPHDDRARTVGPVVQARIVEGDHDAIPTHVRIRLEIAIPECDGRPERLQRVLRRPPRPTAVRDANRAGRVKEPMNAMHSRTHAHSMSRTTHARDTPCPATGPDPAHAIGIHQGLATQRVPGPALRRPRSAAKRP